MTIRGELHPNRTFEHAIGDGLFFRIKPVGAEWEITVGPSGGIDDYARCATPPFHGPNPKGISAWHFERQDGPGGLNEKRWIDFVLSPDAQTKECAEMERAIAGKNTWGFYPSGRCWWRPLQVDVSAGVPGKREIQALRFDAECTLHGALELWRLPATYLIPNGFTGWVTIYYTQKNQSELRKERARYLIPISNSDVVKTSSHLRQDLRGASFVEGAGKPLESSGPNQRIWGWQTGDARMCAPYQSFFVGSREAFQQQPGNPRLRNPHWDCAEIQN